MPVTPQPQNPWPPLQQDPLQSTDAPNSSSAKLANKFTFTLGWQKWFQAVSTLLQSASRNAPTSSTAPGTQGTIAYDANFLYICIAGPQNPQWKRIALTSF